jgi:hypothetical protein
MTLSKVALDDGHPLAIQVCQMVNALPVVRDSWALLPGP